MTISISTLIDEARALHGPDPEHGHPEYARALVELVGSFLPGDPDNIKGYLYPVIAETDYEAAGAVNVPGKPDVAAWADVDLERG